MLLPVLTVQLSVGFPDNDTVAECLTWLSETLASHDRLYFCHV